MEKLAITGELIERVASEMACPGDPAEWRRFAQSSPNAADMQRERVREFLAALERARAG